MDNATFRPTSKQQRNLLLFTVGSAIASATVLTAVFAGHADPGGLLGYGLGFGASSLLTGVLLVLYHRAFATCSAEAIRSRGLSGWQRSCPWSQVEDIRVRQSDPRRQSSTFTVTVFTSTGHRFTLGAPVSGGLMPDPDFEAKVRRIRNYWRAATGMSPDEEAADPIPVYGRPPPSVSARAAAHWSVALILAAALVALPFAIGSGGGALAVRLGSGQPGTFSAVSSSCTGPCFWVGDFRTRDGSLAVPDLALAPGVSISGAGAQVAAVYPGRGPLVYPAGGGTTWIPLAVVILTIAGCAAATAYWIIRWRMRRRRGRPEPAPGRKLGQLGITIVSAAPILLMVFGGVGIAVTANGIPAAGTLPTAVACADYSAWMQAQGDGGGPLVKDPSLLAEAQQHAPPGQLSADLYTLATDVASSVTAGHSMSGLVDQFAAVTEMKAVTNDCFR
jgi:hypothetical protein